MKDRAYKGNISLEILLAIIAMLLNSTIPTQASTIITVNETGMTIANDGKCTLVEAIAAANTDQASGQKSGECPAGNGADVIELGAQLTYSLVAVNNNINGPNGLPSITSQITIAGRGATIERSGLAGTPEFRLFHIASNGNLTLNDVAVRNGRIFVNSREIKNGGAIYNAGRLTLVRSTLFGNQTLGEKGAAGSTTGSGGGGGGGGGFGGAIFNDSSGELTLINSTLSGNQAIGGDGGQGGPGSGFQSGFGGDGGGPGGSGGVPGFPGGAGDFGGGGGGGSGTSEAGSDGGPGGFGGGGGGGGGRSSGGVGGMGGIGGFNGGAGGLNDQGGGGGGGGGAGLGGAIFNNGGSVSITNSTIANNSATGGAGGAGAKGIGGGEDGLSIGGGIYNRAGAMSLHNTIIGDNISGGDCGLADGGLISLGYNLISDTSCPGIFTANGDLINTDPKLDSLQNSSNGVPLHPLLPDSKAIDGVTNPDHCDVETDQRGVSRPQGDFCDIGAFEAQASTITIRKVVVGQAPPSGWQFQLNDRPLPAISPDGGTLTFALVEGPYTLEEITKPGYEVVSRCGGETEGDHLISFTVPPGGRIECVFINTARSATLTIHQTVIGQAPADDWLFNLNGEFLTTFGPTGGSETFDLAPGSYTIEQVVKPGYSVTVECTGGIGGGNRVTLILTESGSADCTFTNQRQINSITILKQTTPTGATNFVFEGDLGDFTLDDGGAHTSGDLTTGSYTVSEPKASLPDPFWSLLYVVCEVRQEDTLLPFTLPVQETMAAFEVAIPFEAGQDVACVFNNERTTFIPPDELPGEPTWVWLPLLLK